MVRKAGLLRMRLASQSGEWERSQGPSVLLEGARRGIGVPGPGRTGCSRKLGPVSHQMKCASYAPHKRVSVLVLVGFRLLRSCLGQSCAGGLAVFVVLYNAVSVCYWGWCFGGFALVHALHISVEGPLSGLNELAEFPQVGGSHSSTILGCDGSEKL